MRTRFTTGGLCPRSARPTRSHRRCWTELGMWPTDSAPAGDPAGRQARSAATKNVAEIISRRNQDAEVRDLVEECIRIRPAVHRPCDARGTNRMRDRCVLRATHDGSIAPRADHGEDLCSHVVTPRGGTTARSPNGMPSRIVGIPVQEHRGARAGCRETAHFSTRNGMPAFFGRRLFVR